MFDESNTPWQFAMSFSGDSFVADGPRADVWQPNWSEKRASQPTANGATGSTGSQPAPSSTTSTDATGYGNG